MKIINFHNYYKTIKKIRIIGGKWRGKKITVIPSPELRPTTNQIRETLFNWLAPVIRGSNCLDCFAGSGALGLEALSRDSHTVTFLEKNKIISNTLRKTVHILNIQKKTKIITTDCIIWLKTPIHHTKLSYNIVFLDPPFLKFYYIKKIIRLLATFEYLSQNAWIYIETKNVDSNLTPIIPNTWKLHKKKSTGSISYQIYIKY